MFRLVAVMQREVDTDALQRALDKMRKRFPGFYVRLKRGAFWYYLEELDKPAQVEPDTLYPCPPVMKGDLPFRIKVYGNRIAGEFSHTICDGTGGITYFQTLLAQYLRELGIDVPVASGILELTEKPDAEELEDSFLRYFREGGRPSRAEGRAHKVQGTRLLPGMAIITTGELSVQAAVEKARSYKVSLTEYLATVLLYALYQLQKAEHPRGKLRPVRVSVPVNLRKYYKTATLRNFSQYMNPGIDPNYGDFTFEEMLAQVHHYFRFMYTEKNLNARMSQNVDAQRNPVLRVVPLFLKKLAIRLVYELTGETVYTSVMSNVGAVNLPPEMAQEITRMDLLLCTAKSNAVECGVISLGDVLSITFTRSIAEPYVERMFFRALVRQGLHVKVESNNA